jgi:hypothetical protein
MDETEREKLWIEIVMSNMSKNCAFKVSVVINSVVQHSAGGSSDDVYVDSTRVK